MNPDQTPEALASVQDTATDLFGDASNPAVEEAIAAAEPTGSAVEPVIPSVTDFKVPEGGASHVDEPVTTPVAAVTTTAAPVVAPPQVPAVSVPAVTGPQAVQYTPEQVAAFQQWQAAQQQQVIPPAVQQPVHQPQAPRALSQPEIDQALNRYTVPVEQFNALFSESDPAKATAILNDILEKKVIQAVTMAHHLIQETQSQITSQVQPYMQFADSQRELMLREQFFMGNPDLKGQDLLIQNVMVQMAQERQAGVYKPASEQQVFSDVATRTKALIAAMQQQGQVVTPQGQRSGVKPPMAVLPAGGGGSRSAATSTAATGVSQTAQNIFG